MILSTCQDRVIQKKYLLLKFILDYLILKLGKPGKIHKVDIDTSYFNGNQPNKVSLEACFAKNKIPNINNVVVAGGVAANKSIKKSLQILCQKNNLKLFSPPLSLCGDNAAMIAWACLQRYKLGYQGDMNFKPIPRWPLNDLV